MEIETDCRTGPCSIKMLADSVARARQTVERLKPLNVVGLVETVESLVPENQDEKLEFIVETALFMLSSSSGEPERQPGKQELDRAMAVLFQKLGNAASTIEDNATRTATRRLEVDLCILATRNGAWPRLQERLLAGLMPRLDELRAALDGLRSTNRSNGYGQDGWPLTGGSPFRSIPARIFRTTRQSNVS